MEIYFDYSSTNRWKNESGLSAARHFLVTAGVSPGRGTHSLADRAAAEIAEARESVRMLLGANQAREVAFTHNATHALNIAIHGILKPGAHVLSTSLDHNSVARPIAAASARGISHTRVEADSTGYVDPARIASSLRNNTKLVVLTHASNVNGAMTFPTQVKDAMGGHDAAILLDATQTAGCIPIQTDASVCDLVAITGHKALGALPGTGALKVREGLELDTIMQGGSGGTSLSSSQPKKMPDRLEPGTPNYLGIVSLGAAAQSLSDAHLGLEHVRQKKMMEEFGNRISDIGAYRTISRPANRDHIPILSIVCDFLHPAELASALDDRGIQVRAGLHCAPHMHQALGTLPHGTLRFSPGPGTTEEHVNTCIDALEEIASA